MAAKSLDEAIKKAMCKGVAKDFPENMKNELRDYLSHEAMKILGTMPSKPEKEIVYKYFKRVIGE